MPIGIELIEFNSVIVRVAPRAKQKKSPHLSKLNFSSFSSSVVSWVNNPGTPNFVVFFCGGKMVEELAR
jgi:hypothetical protein